jgi:hypothetical protein
MKTNAWLHGAAAVRRFRDCGVADKVSGDEILGNWVTDGGESKVEIVRNGDAYSGKIT